MSIPLDWDIFAAGGLLRRMNGKRGCDEVRTKRRSAALQEVASGECTT